MMNSNHCFPAKKLLFNLITIPALCSAVLSAPAQAGNSCEPEHLSSAIKRVAERNLPAVVLIQGMVEQDISSSQLPFREDPFYRFYFNLPPVSRKFKRNLRRFGTGLIMDRQGHILTNYELVEKGKSFEVLLADGRRYSAELVGTDRKADLALLRTSPEEELPHVKFGDSDKVQIGEWVVTIDYVPPLSQFIVRGIITANHRKGAINPGSYEDFLQTDIDVNAGNSGGPLLNLCGDLIGVNTAAISRFSPFEQAGFATPSNMVAYIARRLLRHGKINRGWLGVMVRDLPLGLARSFGLKSSPGVLIVHVMKGSPADKAGLKRGDVLTAYKGKEIAGAATLNQAIAESPVGQGVRLSILRDGKERRATVKVANSPAKFPGRRFSTEALLGVTVRPATSQEANQYNLDLPRGVVITSLHPASPLADPGFEANDLILEVNSRSIGKPEDLVEVINSLKAQEKVTFLGLDHRTGLRGYVRIVVP